MEPEHRRGYGVLYDASNHEQIDTEQLRKLIITMPVPTFSLQNGSGQIVLAVDVSNWLCPDAVCATDRVFCHIYACNGHRNMVPDSPYASSPSCIRGPARGRAPAEPW